MHYTKQLRRVRKIMVDKGLVLRAGAELAYLYAIIEYLMKQEDGEILITAEELSKFMNRTASWIHTNIKKLEDLGLITVTGKKGKGYIIRVNQAVSQ